MGAAVKQAPVPLRPHSTQFAGKCPPCVRPTRGKTSCSTSGHPLPGLTGAGQAGNPDAGGGQGTVDQPTGHALNGPQGLQDRGGGETKGERPTGMGEQGQPAGCALGCSNDLRRRTRNVSVTGGNAETHSMVCVKSLGQQYLLIELAADLPPVPGHRKLKR